MNAQLDLFPQNREALEKELKDRELLFWLFMVYFPKDAYYRPDVTQTQRERAVAIGRKMIPQDRWDDAVNNAKRINEIRETLNWIGK